MSIYMRYLAQRFLIFAATIFISITLVFLLPRFIPGNPLGAIFLQLARMGGSMGQQELVRAYTERFGLDKPLWQQYLSFLAQLVQGNLGYSIASFPSTVSDLIMQALPWTIGLLTVTTLLSWALGSFLGAVIGWRAGGAPLARILVVLLLLTYTIPYYILAIILLFLFAFYFPIFPLSGAYSVGLQPSLSITFILNVLRHAVLPALSIVLVSLGWWFLSMRSLITSIKGEDYILWAEAKGLRPGRILWRYAFRNALLPQATGLALSLGNIVGGALITEVIFGYPGLGWLIYNSIKGVDYPVIQGSALLIIVSVALANFVIDSVYPLIDPRVRLGAGGRS
ncbi:MAG TPA: ABC transporter permease [Chloroflexota bacterium]|nr:ABC transporter permease [Chloroflexota bacterium]